jgi:hypothetical protein
MKGYANHVDQRKSSGQIQITNVERRGKKDDVEAEQLWRQAVKQVMNERKKQP